MSTCTSLLIILYTKVNRDAALRSSKVFHPKLLIMVVTCCFQSSQTYQFCFSIYRY